MVTLTMPVILWMASLSVVLLSLLKLHAVNVAAVLVLVLAAGAGVIILITVLAIRALVLVREAVVVLQQPVATIVMN